MNLKTIHIKEDIKEKDFIETIKRYGYRGIKFIKRNDEFIKETMLKISPNEDRISDALYDFEYTQLGKPDFFIWSYKFKEFYFCEFKSKNDVLPTHQLNWFHLNHHLPRAIAFVYPQMSIFLNLSQQEITDIEMYHCIQFHITDQYCKKYFPSTMHLYNGSWVGTLPVELSKLLHDKGFR